METPTLDHVSECLNQADPEEILALASRCLDDDPEATVTRRPTVGVLVTQVREPVAEERFILGDVLACQAEVHRRGHHGWAMRLGDDTLTVLAAAILAAEYAADGPRRDEITALCDHTIQARKEARAAEWERLSPSIVEFQEIL